MQLSNSPLASLSDNGKNIGIAAVVKHGIVILFSIYLVCIPLGRLGDKRFKPVDIGILMIVLIMNSDVKFKEMIENISSAKLTPTSVEVTLREKVEKLSEKVDSQAEKLNDQAKRQVDRDKADAEAKNLVDLQLSDAGHKNLTVSELRKKIHSASYSATETIYKMAKDARRNSCNKKGIIERTIPIFQALIDSKYENDSYRFYAQLGYALKDQENPDWGKAENKLDSAISLWKQKHPNDNLPSLYCFNWLFCVANLRDKLELEQEEIDQRIKSAMMCKTLCEEINKHKNILDWISKNYSKDMSDLIPKFNNLSESCWQDSDEQKKLLFRV